MVGLAGLAASHDPAIALSTDPLGACLGVAIYDPVVKVAGLLHSMLPDSTIDPKRAAERPGMFLDTGLAELLRQAHKLGAKTENLQVFVAGGAQIMDESAAFNIAKRNYEILTELIAKMNLRILAEDIGGRTNRTMSINVASGEVQAEVFRPGKNQHFMQAIEDYINNLRISRPPREWCRNSCACSTSRTWKAARSSR